MWYILVARNLRRRYRGAWMLWGEVALILILILILIPSLYCDCDWVGFSTGLENIWVGFWGVSGILATPIYIPYTPSVSRLTPFKVPLTVFKCAIFALNGPIMCHFVHYACIGVGDGVFLFSAAGRIRLNTRPFFVPL